MLNATATDLIERARGKASHMPTDERHDWYNVIAIYIGILELMPELDAEGDELLHRVHERLIQFVES